jgi:hypothetical protein
MGELFAALFIMAVGLSAAGAGTHLYQAVSRNPAELSFAGETYFAAMGRLAMSFVCGPYIMLKLGFAADAGDKPKMGTTLLASFVAFGWAFITGLILLGIHMAFTGA